MLFCLCSVNVVIIVGAQKNRLACILLMKEFGNCLFDLYPSINIISKHHLNPLSAYGQSIYRISQVFVEMIILSDSIAPQLFTGSLYICLS